MYRIGIIATKRFLVERKKKLQTKIKKKLKDRIKKNRKDLKPSPFLHFMKNCDIIFFN